MQPPPIPPDSTRADVEAALAELSAHATEWARLPIWRKVEMLEGLKPRVSQVAGRWVTAASRAKGLPVESPLRGEEWSSGPWALLTYLEPLARTLRHIEAGTLGDLVEGRMRQRPDGQTVVRVMPDGAYDRLLLSGMTGEVWMEPGVSPADVPGTMAGFYREDAPAGGVGVVLGAGNIASIPPLDVVYELFAHGRVVLLKMNPVNSYLGPLLEEAFEEFVAAGYLRLAYGGADVGEQLTRHEAIDHIHVTGAAATHDAIVYGTGPEGEARKARDEPQIATPVSAELGGVSPCVVVPGDWSEPDLRFQAEHVASQKLHNCGFNCIGTQVLVLPEAWPQREAFLAELEAVFAELPARPAYYPGAGDRLAAFAEAYPEADRAGGVAVAEVPPEPGQPAFTGEVFGPALAVVSLPGGGPDDDPADWLDAAVAWCNETLAGTLGATLLVHPRTRRALGDRFEDAVAALRYGTVGVNLWAGGVYFVPGATWGAFPGHARDDIQSGTGVVHNAYLFGRPQKSVAYGPFAPFPRSLLLGEAHAAPTPIYFVTNETAHITTRRVTEFAAAPSPAKLPGIFASALRG